MADGGYIAPPTEDPSKEKIWVETQKRLDRFLPNLFAEIPFKAEVQKPQPPQTPTQQEPTSSITPPELPPQPDHEESHSHPTANETLAKTDVLDAVD